MNRKEFEAQRELLRKEIQRISNKEKELKERYGKECLERSGYRIGDRVTIDGVTGEITGVEISWCVYARCNRVRKDGTLSSQTCHFLRIKLTEED